MTLANGYSFLHTPAQSSFLAAHLLALRHPLPAVLPDIHVTIDGDGLVVLMQWAETSLPSVSPEGFARLHEECERLARLCGYRYLPSARGFVLEHEYEPVEGNHNYSC
jgi:hypothetical protein